MLRLKLTTVRVIVLTAAAACRAGATVVTYPAPPGAQASAPNEPRGHIRGVTFNDIAVTGQGVPAIKLNGADAGHLIEDLRFEHLRLQGTLIRDATAAKLQTNAFVRGLHFD